MRVLAIIHQADAGPGVFAPAATAAGAELHSWRPDLEPAPPGPPHDYDATITFGGATHPDQDENHPWLTAERAFLRQLIETEVPLLGVCLGAELVAQAAGGAVRRAARSEIGWIPVSTTRAAATDPLVSLLPTQFDALEWHSFECLPPPGATELARSDNCLQAYRVGDKTWGIQFHAEVTADDFASWLDDYGDDRDARAVGIDAPRLRAATAARIDAWNELGRGLCQRFLELAR